MNTTPFSLNKKAVGLLIVFMVVVAIFLLAKPLAEGPLAVARTVPAQNESHNPFAPVTIEFNRAPRANEYQISIDPKTDFTVVTHKATSIQIRPKTNFAELASYTITISTRPAYKLSFKTQQTASNVPGWNELFDQALDQAEQINGAQDRALAEIRKGVPIEQVGFSVDYAYSTNTFTISLSAPHEQNRAKFLAWIKNRGVSDLSTVTIKYVNK